MGAFYVLLTNEHAEVSLTSKGIDRLIRDQGFASGDRICRPQYHLCFYPKLNGSRSAIYRDSGDDFCAISGTLIYKGEVAGKAAKQVYSDFDCKTIPYAGAVGCYCVVIRKFGKTFLWIDQLGLYKVFHNESGSFWSSSFLAAVAQIEKPVLDRQSIYEYVFQGATYGSDAVVDGVKLADPATLYNLDGTCARADGNWWHPDSPKQIEGSIDRCLERVRSVFDSIAVLAGNPIDTAVSGGYDSRLVLALLLEQGIDPRIHVYGAADSSDVEIARHIGRHLRKTIKHIDKSRLYSPPPDMYPEVVSKNFSVFDGLPTDGIFDNGADVACRQQCAADGSLMLNGGGGEIFRNFFYLPDRPFSVKKIVWSFYSQFAPSYCTDRFDQSRYRHALERRIMKSLGTEEKLLRRDQIELIYPLFRLRYWMGKNNSINNRFGMALTPFSEPTIVREAMTIPIAEKNAGRFEARMIQAISPNLAACRSSYGHSFVGNPPVRRVVKETLTLIRPPFLRQYSYRIKQFLRSNPVGKYLTKEYLDACGIGNFEIMGEYFNVERIRDPAVMSRIATLEYFCQRVGAYPDTAG